MDDNNENKRMNGKMNNNNNDGLAPIANLSSVIPSLNTSPSKSNDYIDKSFDNSDDVEKKYDVVQFMDDDLMSSTHSIDDEKKPKIPDGGWGWMVVLSSVIISMIADGISFSFGLLYIEFLHEFGASKSATSWIGSLFMAVPLLTGPVMSAFVDRYGCRMMTCVGGLISATGFIISAHVKTIGLMYVTFGVIAGLGLGLCYVTAVVSIAFWFDKKRNLATGIGACGSGIGTFIYAPMTQYLIEEYGWRGTTLLLAGTFLNMCVCGVLMRDPDWQIEENAKSSKKTSTTVSCKSLNEMPDLEEIRKLLKNGQNTEYLLKSLITSVDKPGKVKVVKDNNNRSVVDLPTFIKQNEKVPFEVLEQLSSNKRLYNVILENYPTLLSCRSTSEKGLNNLDLLNNTSTTATRVPVTFSMKLKKSTKPKKMVHQYSLPEQTAVHEPLVDKRKYSLRQPPMMLRSDSLPRFRKYIPTNHNYFKNIKLHRNSLMHRRAMLNFNKYRIRASSCPNIYTNSMTTLAKEREDKWYSEFVDLLKDIADFSMFSELHFIYISITTILFFVWFIVPYFYLAEHMTRHNYSETEASHALSVIGVTTTFGMVILGWMGDQPWMDVKIGYSVCLVLCGLSCTGILIFTDYYVLLLISSGCFGFFFASTYVFTPVLLIDLINLENFTTAYGLSLLCQGIGHLIGPPVAGLLFDFTDKWDQSFIQAGVWICISSIFILLIKYTKNRKLWGKTTFQKDSISEA